LHLMQYLIQPDRGSGFKRLRFYDVQFVAQPQDQKT